MPHPLPEDVFSVTGLKWFIVAVPDDDAYSRAAMDIYTEMANFWKWGKEGPVPIESDLAAQQWADAIYASMEFIQLGFAESLLGYIDEVEGKLQAIADAVAAVEQITQINACCEQIPGPPQPDPGIDIDVGDPPTTYGDTTLTEGWNEYKRLTCGAALAWVDGMEDLLETLQDAVGNGLIVLGGLAAILAIFSGLGLIAAVVAVGFTGALGLFSAISAGATSATIGSAAAWFRLNKQAIADVIFCAGSAEQAEIDVKAYIEAEVTALQWAILQWFDYRKGMRAIYSGLDDAGNALAVPESTNCSCTNPDPVICQGELIGENTYNSTLAGTCYKITLWWPNNVFITSSAIPQLGCDGQPLFRVYADTDECSASTPGATLVYSSSNPPSGEFGNLIILNVNGEFDATITASTS